MDLDAFTSDRLGTVRKTIDGYYAYFPDPDPRELDYDATTVRKLTDATSTDSPGSAACCPALRSSWAPYVRLEAVLSSRIEGTQTSVGELLLFEADDHDDDLPEGDLLEVVNYTRALDHALSTLNRLPLSLRLLRETHAILMSGVRGETMTPGEFRRSQTWIGPPGSTLQTARFVPPPVDEMNDALADLERFLHKDELPNLVALALAHYRYEAIHPFLDGNGRIGRLLVPLALCHRGVLERPMLYLSAYFERHRSRYYHVLFETSATGDPVPWINFFLEA